MQNLFQISQPNNMPPNSIPAQHPEMQKQQNSPTHGASLIQLHQYDPQSQNVPPTQIPIPIRPPTQISIPEQIHYVPHNLFPAAQITQLQMHQKYDNPMNMKKPSYRKSMWTPTEDKQLLSAVEKYGTNNWCIIANNVKGRTGKQCRERWSGILNPKLAKQPWTPEEDNQLKNLHNLLGNKWSTIALQMPGRSTIALRNRWSWHIRHSKRIASVYIVNASMPKQAQVNQIMPPPNTIPQNTLSKVQNK